MNRFGIKGWGRTSEEISISPLICANIIIGLVKPVLLSGKVVIQPANNKRGSEQLCFDNHANGILNRGTCVS